MKKIFILDDGTILASIVTTSAIDVFDNPLEVSCYIKTPKNGNISATIAWTRVLENPFCVDYPKAIETYRGGAEKLRYEYIKRGGDPEEAKKFLKEIKNEAVTEYRLYLEAEAKEQREKDAKERAEAFKKELKSLLDKYQFDLVMTTEPTAGCWELDGSIADLVLEDNKFDTGDEKITLATVENDESFTFK